MTNSSKAKESLIKRTRFISDVSEAVTAITEIISSKVIAVDLKGMDSTVEGGGCISIVTVALPDGTIYIFDVYTCPTIMFDGKLIEVLESDQIKKVMHNSNQGAGALIFKFNVRLRNVFDTQCAYQALQLVDPYLMNEELIPLLIDVHDLLRFFDIQTLNKKVINERNLLIAQHPTNIWKERPLTTDLKYYAASDVSSLIFLYNRMNNERILKENRFLIDNLIYEALFSQIIPLAIRKRRTYRQNQLRRWRNDVKTTRHLYPYYEEIPPNDYVWKNDYDVTLANPKIINQAMNHRLNHLQYSKDNETMSSQDKIDIIDTKFYNSYTKKYFFDVKQNVTKSTKFVKISEVNNIDSSRNQIHITMCVIGRLKEYLEILYNVHKQTPRHRYRETRTLKSESLIKDTRRYFIDLKENGRARFVTISQLLPVGGKLSSIAFNVQDLKPIIELIEDIHNENCDPDEGDTFPEGNYLRCNNKRFFFNISKNNKGAYLRISEVAFPAYRTSITVPERSWGKFIDIFRETCDLYKSADESTTPRSQSQCGGGGHSEEDEK